MKTITDTLRLARSNIAERVKGIRPKRGPQNRAGDLELAADIRRLVDARPTHRYRRIAALLKRERRADGMAPVNAKRVYRLMKRHRLLLVRHTGRRGPREHDGQVATLRSNIRWCSDGLEFACWNGEVVRIEIAVALIWCRASPQSKARRAMEWPRPSLRPSSATTSRSAQSRMHPPLSQPECRVSNSRKSYPASARIDTSTFGVTVVPTTVLPDLMESLMAFTWPRLPPKVAFAPV